MKKITVSANVQTPINIVNQDKAIDIPGGISLDHDTLVKGSILVQGTPISSPTDGIRYVCKQAVLLAGSTSTALKIESSTHNFKVGDIVTLGADKLASAITAISSSSGVDTLTVVTIGTVAEGNFIYEATAATVGTDSTLLRNADSILAFAMSVPTEDLVILPADAYVSACVLENVIGAEYLSTLKGILTIKY